MTAKFVTDTIKNEIQNSTNDQGKFYKKFPASTILKEQYFAIVGPNFAKTAIYSLFLVIISIKYSLYCIVLKDILRH